MNFLAWWNLIFELPVVAACLLSTVATLGADAHGHHDGDAAGDGHDVGHAAGHEVDGHELAGHDAGGHDSGSYPTAGHGSHESESDAAGWLATIVAIPGGDRAPLSIVLVVLWLVFGFAGLASNAVLARFLHPIAFVWPSIVFASVAGLTASRGFARAFARILPKAETYALGRDACVGRTAKMTATLSEADGYAQLYDAHRNLLEVRVKAAPGTVFRMGAPIVLVSYDETAGCYSAEPFEAENSTSSNGSNESDRTETSLSEARRNGRDPSRHDRLKGRE